MFGFFFSSRRRHTRLVSDWSSDVCSSDLLDESIRLAREGPYPVSEAFARKDRALVLLEEGDLDRAEEFARQAAELFAANRSEERRVGKECRSRWSRYR